MDNDKRLRQLEEEQKRLMEDIERTNRIISGGDSSSHGKNDLLEFIIGLILLGAVCSGYFSR